jgi:hypothetical protein
LGWLNKDDTEILLNSRAIKNGIARILEEVEDVRKLCRSSAMVEQRLSNKLDEVITKLDKVLIILEPPPAVGFKVDEK